MNTLVVRLIIGLYSRYIHVDRTVIDQKMNARSEKTKGKQKKSQENNALIQCWCVALVNDKKRQMDSRTQKYYKTQFL